MVLKRPRLMHTESLEERLNIEAQRLLKEAWRHSPGVERSRLIRKARLAETASQLSDWLRSPGLRAPT
ncbi:hypothetical protein HAP47_0015415 [Bradyrhizobium sp. 41S5]|nr:hypothetical protein [Bradyrhizobium sp. 41S5]UFX47969.1 hypothetical protein HAP47_0015415 [Bradyrhizobium sp. 41S5]